MLPTQYPGLQTTRMPAPLVIGKVSHHSIELSWESAEEKPRTGPPEKWTCFSVEEINPKMQTCGIIYVQVSNRVVSGYSTRHTVEGLEPSKSYNFRLTVTRPSGEIICSPVVSVSTTREPMSGKNLHSAINMDDHEELRRVLQSGMVNVNVPDKMGFTPLMVAVQKGFYRTVRILVEHGADVRMKNSSGKDSLMLACFCGHLDIVKYLRKFGALWTSEDTGGRTPLHWAADGGHVPVVAYMIQDGCEVDVRDRVSHWTPLMRVSAVSGMAAVASLLIRAGADVNVRDKDGKTPLMVAVLNGHEELVQLLLKNGADHLMKNEFGSGAAEMAKAFGRQNIISLFEEKKIH